VTAVISLSASLLFATPAGLSANKRSPDLPIPVTVCQLESHPNAYDHKLVEVRGRIYFGKFDFVIDATCEPHSQAGVWLDLGGDVQSPAEYWGLATFLFKHKGADVQVKGITIPLVHNALLDEFVNDVRATRFRKPNGDGCGSECLFYEVSATLRGRFFSGTKGGFGMEQCCHLLVIEKVVSVSSKRTGVPAGGEFQCTSDRWQPTAEELKALSAILGCSLRDDFKNCYPVLAKHWGDTINPMEGLTVSGPWMSPDMTVSYKFAGGFISKAGQPTVMTPSSSVTRDVCHSVSPPKQPSDHVYCDSYRADGLEDKNAAMDLQNKVAGGSEIWRSTDMARVGWLAYEDAIKQWNLPGPAPLKLAKCEPWPPATDGDGNEQQWGYCTWFAGDDLQQITINLHRPGYLKKSAGQLQKVAWIAAGVEANLCRTGSEPR
jgi:hypothetical protein